MESGVRDRGSNWKGKVEGFFLKYLTSLDGLGEESFFKFRRSSS